MSDDMDPTLRESPGIGRDREGDLGSEELVPASPEPTLVVVGEILLPTISRCPYCDVVAPSPPDQRDVRIVKISQKKDGWRAEGQFFSCRCPTCAAVFRGIVESVPVECAEYPCPRCGPGSILRTDVLALTDRAGYYDFEATLRCPKCEGRRRFRSKLSAPFRALKRLKLGPGGVEIETHEPRSSDSADP